MTVFSLLGLPGSGKSFYGQQLATAFHIPFLPEIATQLIHKKGFVPGAQGSLQFDQEIYMANIQTTNEVLALDHSVIWEGGPLQDRVFIEARIKFRSHISKRRQLLTLYESSIFKRLHRHTYYLLFDIAPTSSLQRQKTRQKPELLTVDLDFLADLRDKLLLFCETHPQQTWIVDMHQSKQQVIDQLFHKFQELC
jgi:adenylate kinase family enzyme